MEIRAPCARKHRVAEQRGTYTPQRSGEHLVFQWTSVSLCSLLPTLEKNSFVRPCSQEKRIPSTMGRRAGLSLLAVGLVPREISSFLLPLPTSSLTTASRRAARGIPVQSPASFRPAERAFVARSTTDEVSKSFQSFSERGTISYVSLI